MSERTPRLASDLFRLWLCTGIAFVCSFGTSFCYAVVVVSSNGQISQFTALVASTLGLVIVLFGLYQILTWRVFAPLAPGPLRDLVRKTSPRTTAERWYNLMSGNGPKSLSLASATVALLAVVVVVVDPQLRASPIAIVASILTVALSWTMIVFANATTYMRENADRLNQLEFPDRDADHPPAWRDYLYLAVQVSTTFSSSDVTVRTTRMRGKITAHSIVAFVFNTVILALVVSAITIVAG